MQNKTIFLMSIIFSGSLFLNVQAQACHAKPQRLGQSDLWVSADYVIKGDPASDDKILITDNQSVKIYEGTAQEKELSIAFARAEVTPAVNLETVRPVLFSAVVIFDAKNVDSLTVTKAIDQNAPQPRGAPVNTPIEGGLKFGQKYKQGCRIIPEVVQDE